jgi:branched-chain amino acid transport system ATP-binding protein
MSLFDVQGVVARHGLLTAVRDVSFSVARGEVLAIVGANGAGKTTLFRTISGVHPASAGYIRLDGADIGGLRPHERVMAGVAMVPEGRRLFSEMSVLENLQVAGENGRKGDWTIDSVSDALPILKPLMRQAAGSLSGGQRQAVAIGRALMCNPALLLLDEVSLGLSPAMIQELYDSLEGIKKAGNTTMVLVEQDLDRVMSFSDRIVCLLEGQIVLEGAAAALGKAEVTNAYFGLDTEEPTYA